MKRLSSKNRISRNRNIHRLLHFMVSSLLILTILVSLSFTSLAASMETVEESETISSPERETILSSEITFPVPYEQYGMLYCDRIGFRVAVYWDDTDEILDWGAGTSMAGFLPGSGKVIILSGHTLTHFRYLEYMEVGDVLHFDTTYGEYEYEITSIEVYDENDLLDLLIEKTGYEEETEESMDFSEPLGEETEENNNLSEPLEETEKLISEVLEEPKQQEELILYTCYPFYKISERKTNRYTVIPRCISGPQIITETEEEITEPAFAD